MAHNRVWVRGTPGRLTRIERGGKFLSVTDWKKVTLTKRVQDKADRGSLEIRYSDPNAKSKSKPAPVATEEKEAN